MRSKKALGDKLGLNNFANASEPNTVRMPAAMALATGASAQEGLKIGNPIHSFTTDLDIRQLVSAC